MLTKRPMLRDFLQERSSKQHRVLDTTVIRTQKFKSRYNTLIKQLKSVAINYYMKDSTYYIHIKLPSKVNEQENRREELLYDIVLQFDSPQESIGLEATLQHYTVKVFSNSPSFVFKYGYVYFHIDMLVDVLVDKFDDKVLLTRPKKMNPTEDIGFDFSVYFAIVYLVNRPELLRKSNFKTKGKPFKELSDTVSDYYEILRIHANKQKHTISNMRKRATLTFDKIKRKVVGRPKSQSGVATVATVKATKKVGATKATRSVKRTKVIGKR